MTVEALKNSNNVCTKTVAHDLCVGCGVCAGICPAHNLTMTWNQFGQYQPVDSGRCLDTCHRCLDVCPFQDHEQNEDTLAAASFSHIEGIQHRPETGYYLKGYVGYANDGYRERGASGGLASWMLSALLTKGEVDQVICVRPSDDPHQLFTYTTLHTTEEIQHSAQSAYYPVELSGVIQDILNNEARYAIIGLPCFLKALRLAILADHRLQNRIVILIGLVCGQLKSRAFTEYLLESFDLPTNEIRRISFRNKQVNKTAFDISFAAYTSKDSYSIPWSNTIGPTWMSSEFRLTGCEFCDDVFAEVADVVCMDAWLPTYVMDGRGTSIVLARSKRMNHLLKSGIALGWLSLHTISIDDVIASQNDVILRKKHDLKYRLWLAQMKRERIPKKRVFAASPPFKKRKLLQMQEELRAKSHILYNRSKRTIIRSNVYNDYIKIPRYKLSMLYSLGILRRVVLSLIKKR